jgi:hypothetical protein
MCFSSCIVFALDALPSEFLRLQGLVSSCLARFFIIFVSLSWYDFPLNDLFYKADFSLFCPDL